MRNGNSDPSSSRSASIGQHQWCRPGGLHGKLDAFGWVIRYVLVAIQTDDTYLNRVIWQAPSTNWFLVAKRGLSSRTTNYSTMSATSAASPKLYQGRLSRYGMAFTMAFSLRTLKSTTGQWLTESWCPLSVHWWYSRCLTVCTISRGRSKESSLTVLTRNAWHRNSAGLKVGAVRPESPHQYDWGFHSPHAWLYCLVSGSPKARLRSSALAFG